MSPSPAGRRGKSLLTALLVASALGCSQSQGSRGPLPQQERTTVRVDNRNFLDMTIYVLRGSQRVRLGTVTGGQTSVLTIPESVMFGMTSLRFMMDPLGSTQQGVSYEVTVTPGDEVVLTIP